MNKELWSRILISMLAVFIGACASSPKVEGPLVPSKDEKISATLPELNRPIDYISLQRSLGLSREFDNLGYAERSFNTCQAGYGYSSSRGCRQETLAVIHFQLLCRDSEGTISTTLSREDMRPLSLRSIKWTLKEARGTIQLDSEGYGQIQMVFRNSPKYQRVKLSSANENLYMKAGEITRVITPQDWCN